MKVNTTKLDSSTLGSLVSQLDAWLMREHSEYVNVFRIDIKTRDLSHYYADITYEDIRDRGW